MKKVTSITMLSLLSFLLFIIGNAMASPEPVLTLSGEALLPTEYYYMVSVIRGAGGGGLLPFPANLTNPNSCIFNVVQSSSDLENGHPIGFSYLTGSDPIYADVPGLRASFRFPVWICTRFQQFWTLAAGSEDGTAPAHVTTTSTVPELEWYRIVNMRYQGSINAYKLMHCFSCPRCLPARPDICTDLGVDRNGGNRLVLRPGEPFVFYFLRAADGSKTY